MFDFNRNTDDKPYGRNVAPRRGMVAAMLALLTSLALVLGLTGCASLAGDAGARSVVGDTAQSAPQGMFTATQTTGGARGEATDAQSATVLVYMNGSDLESQAGEATSDIAEMLKSGIGKNANVIIETLGTREWHNYDIASDHTQRYRVNQGKLELVDDSLGQLDTTSADTLADFIRWGVQNYPADRYMLLLWDHGAGPVYGFGYDEFQGDYAALTLDEIQAALKANANVHFDLIGMDCCLMSSIETCQVLAPFSDYAVLSEDFEPGVGWSYSNWMGKLEQNPGIGTVELGKTIVDDMVAATKEDPDNGDATLALIDESAADDMYRAWIAFAYANKDNLVNTNYSQETTWRTRTSKPGPNANGGHGYDSSNTWDGGDPWGNGNTWDGSGVWGDDSWGGNAWGGNAWGDDNSWDELFDYWDTDTSYVTMSDYYVTDVLTVAGSVDSNESNALKAAVDRAIVHFAATSGEEGMTGIGVTLPYGDAEFYDQLVDVFTKCGIDQEYVAWLEAFVASDSSQIIPNAPNAYDDVPNAPSAVDNMVDLQTENWA